MAPFVQNSVQFHVPLRPACWPMSFVEQETDQQTLSGVGQVKVTCQFPGATRRH